MTTTADQRACPNCGAPMPVDSRLVTWCEACDWNVDPLADPTPLAGRAARRQRRVDQAAKAQFDRLVRAPIDRPYRGRAWFAGLALATLVHLLTLAVAAAGVFAVLFLPWVSKVLIGGPTLALTWLLVPKPRRLPKRVLRRADAPALYGLLDEVAQVVGTKAADVVTIDGGFNAYFTRVGLRRRRLLGIGLPLWAVLSPQQRAALVGHELAHDVNGDMRSRFWVGSALRALAHWYDSLVPDRDTDYAVGSGVFTRTVLAGLAGAAYGVSAVLARVSFSDSQRAEYLADDLGARVAGTAATSELLEHCLLGDTVDFAVEHALRTAGSDVWGTVRAMSASVPDRERMRRRRAAALRNLRIDESHPPTHLRIAFAQARGPHEPAVILSESASAAIDAELADAAADVVREFRRVLPR